jgi:hypothetical protein
MVFFRIKIQIHSFYIDEKHILSFVFYNIFSLHVFWSRFSFGCNNKNRKYTGALTQLSLKFSTEFSLTVMESQPPVTGTTARNAAEPSQPQPQQPPPSSLPSSSSSTPPISTPSHPSPIPNPNLIQTQNPKPPTSIPPQSRPPPSFTRNPTPPQSHYSHFSSIPPSATPSPASSFPSTPSSSISSASAPRGGMAIGVPAHHQNPSPPFSSSFGQHFGGLGRSDSTSNSNTSQVGFYIVFYDSLFSWSKLFLTFFLNE